MLPFFSFLILLFIVDSIAMYCSWNATYESLLGTNKPLPQPIPLPVSLLGCGGFGPCYFLGNKACVSWLYIWFQLTGNGRFSCWCLGAGGLIRLSKQKHKNISKYYVLSCNLYKVLITENMLIKDKAWTTMSFHYCSYELFPLYIQACLICP